MEIPLEIAFKRTQPSDALRTVIEREAAKLERYHERITACRVVIEAPGHRRRKGGLFGIRLHLVVPGRREVVVTRSPPEHHAHADPYVTIRDAFDEARRQLQDIARDLRDSTKAHETPPHGRVAKLFPDHGFIETPEGLEIYFHRNSVLNAAFDQLETGTEVRFAEEMGENGPQASTVHVIGKHHIAGSGNG